MFTKLKIRLLSYGYHTVMLRLYYGKGSKRYRKRSGNGAEMGREWNDRTARMGGTGETDGDKGERRFSGKLITRVDKITDIGEKVMPKFANTEKFL